MHSRNILFSWLAIMLCVILDLSTEFSSDDIVRFSNNNRVLKFNHLVVDKNQGWVFVGAVDHLYQFNENLTLNQNLSMIPVSNKSITSYYNKLLILDYCKYRIIACSCNNFSSSVCNIYKIETKFSIPRVSGAVVTVDPDVSTVAFISSNSVEQGKCKNSSPLLYVGVTFSQRSKNHAIPAVVARSLEDNSLLDAKEVKEKDHSKFTTISFRDEWQKKYIVNYVYGFSSGSHGYFLTTQMNTTRSPPYISKIIVICLSDNFYNSYVEIPIECIDKSQKIYNLVQAAFVAKPTSELAASLSITTDDDVLFGVFARSEGSKGAESNVPLQNESALCIFPLKSINDKVVKNLEKCSKTKGNRGLEHILSGNETCEDIDDVSNFCKKIKPFGGNLPAKSTSVLTFDTLLTSVAAVPKFNSTIVFAGTRTGYLKQIVVKNMKTAWECDDLDIEERSPINPDMLFDSNMDNLYAMTDHELVKIKIRNPLPSILHIRPDKGPWEGGTKITITGENVKIRFKGTNIIATAAGIPCKLYNVENQSPNEIVCITNGSESKFREGPIDLLVDGMQVTSGPNFAFVNPKIFKIVSEKGPIFGKIEVLIKGEHLDVGNSKSIFVGNTSCPIISINSTDIKCAPQSSNFITDTTFNVGVKIDNWVQMNDLTLGYDKDLENYTDKYNPKPAGIPAGGIPFFIRVKGVPYTQQLIFKVFTENQTYESFCNMDHNFIALCHSPQMLDINSSTIDVGDPKIFNYSLTPNETNPETSYNNSNTGNFFLYPDPYFGYFSIVSDDDEIAKFEIKGQNINITCRTTDFDVLVGKVKCEVIVVYRTELTCRLEKSKILNFENTSDHNRKDFSSYENITVQIGKNVTIFVPKQPRIEIPKPIPLTHLLYTAALGLTIITSLVMTFRYVYRKKYLKNSKKMKERMTRLELCVAAECKEAFAELQTETNFTAESLTDGLPFFSYPDYVMKNLFPNLENHTMFLNESTTPIIRTDRLKLLDSLIKNKTFLLVFIKTLEKNDNFSMKDRVYIASVLMITLQSNMDYCTEILETLLINLIKKYTKGRSHPKLLLRRTESVVEKMLSIWFTFLLYKFLCDSAGKPLFKLFTAMKQHINKGPVDMITFEARYSLNQDKLIRQHVNYNPITVHVNVSGKTAAIIKLKSGMKMVPVAVLDCDTITQVKEKILDVIFHNTGFSKFPNVSKFELKWMTGTTDGKILYDDDTSSKIENRWRRKNTLLHYGIPDGAMLHLLSIEELRRPSGTPSVDFARKSPNINSMISNCVKPQLSYSACAMTPNNEGYFKEWHLVKPDCPDQNLNDKMVSEIYLTRVLGTKVTLQRFVDDLFAAVLTKPYQSNCFPVAIKYMFDFLDEQAAHRGITDWEVVHAWKNNCLPLRFWVNLIKNPNFLFDVHKPNIVDSCLSVVAQAFMDSCSTADHHISKDSPTSKLLYAKDIPLYRERVKKYYADIKAMPAVSRKHTKIMFAKEFLRHANDFNTNTSISELHKFMIRYKNDLTAAFKEDKVAQKYLLVNKFEDAMNAVTII